MVMAELPPSELEVGFQPGSMNQRVRIYSPLKVLPGRH